MIAATNPIVQDSAADWNAGVLYNADTTTVSGSVSMIDGQIIQYPVSTLSYGVWGDLSSVSRRESFIPPISSTMSVLNMYRFPLVASGALKISITDKDMNILVSSNVSCANPTYDAINIQLNTYLAANDTYYILIETNTVGGGQYFTRHGWNNGTPPGGNGLEKLVSGTWQPVTYGGSGVYLLFKIYPDTAAAVNFTSVQSQVLNAGPTWDEWNIFSADVTLPTGSTANYYAVTATSTFNLTTNSSFPLVNGEKITSPVGPYMIIFSSLSRTDSSVKAILNSESVSFIESAHYSCVLSSMQATALSHWGRAVLTDYQPTGSSITYRIQLSSSGDNWSTLDFIDIRNAELLSYASAYINTQIDFYRTVGTASPRVDSFYYLVNAGDPLYTGDLMSASTQQVTAPKDFTSVSPSTFTALNVGTLNVTGASTFTQGVTYNDGTTQTTAYEQTSSICTNIASFNTSSTGWVMVAGSSSTITTGGNTRILYGVLNSGYNNSVSAQDNFFDIRLDGASLGGSNGLLYIDSAGNSLVQNFTFSGMTIDPVSSGTHILSLWVKTSGGTLFMPAGNTALYLYLCEVR
jgi:hypothetical protein